MNILLLGLRLPGLRRRTPASRPLRRHQRGRRATGRRDHHRPGRGRRPAGRSSSRSPATPTCGCPKYKSQVLINQSLRGRAPGRDRRHQVELRRAHPPLRRRSTSTDSGRWSTPSAASGCTSPPRRGTSRRPAPARTGAGLDIKTAGCQTLNGTQALAWVRSRYFQYYEAGKWRSDPTSDIGRISRQQDFLRRLMAQAVEKGAFNPIRANRLADAAMANLTVDSSFDVKDGLRIVQAFRPVGPAGVEMMALPTKSVGVHLAASDAAQPVLARLRGEADPGERGGERQGSQGVPVRGEGAGPQRDGHPRGGRRHRRRPWRGRLRAGRSGRRRHLRLREDGDPLRPERPAEGRAAGAATLGGVGKLVSDSTVRGTDLVLVIGADWKGVTAPAGVRPGRRSGADFDHRRLPPTTTAKGAAPSTAPAPAGGPAQPAC